MPNDEVFQGNPVKLEGVSRSVYHRMPTWTGSWSAGELVPIFATSSVMPGDQFKMKIRSAIRMATPKFPTMDDAQITVEAYFVPHRLLLSRRSMSPSVNDANQSWQAFIGAQDSLINVPFTGQWKLPKCVIQDQTDYLTGGLSDCLYHSEPQSTGGTYAVNCLKYLAYASIWNEFWREPNIQSPITFTIATGGSGALESQIVTFAGWPDVNGVNGVSTFAVASKIPLAPVSRFHGYFGSALPWPQRNTSGVQLPLGSVAPLIAGDAYAVKNASGSSASVHLRNSDGTFTGLFAQRGSSLLAVNSGSYNVAGSPAIIEPTLDSGTMTSKPINMVNLYTDLSQATAATVNQFRLAVQTQRWYEHLARCGNKYPDLIHGMFGVRNQALSDRPEYLGGITAPISVFQVAATAGASTGSGSSTATMGQLGAYSLTNLDDFLFDKAFTEHGTLMIVMCVRTDESFSQGCQREDFRFDKFDFYWPEFANIGEQEILRRELYVAGSASSDNTVFGYQEAWAEYRYFPSVVTGYTRPEHSGSLGFVTYANYFSSAPDLGGFLNAYDQRTQVDRTLQVAGTTSGFQFYGQFGFEIEMIRPMPLYSIPGLVDHH